MPYLYPKNADLIEYGPQVLEAFRIRDFSKRSMLVKAGYVVEGYFLEKAFGEDGLPIAYAAGPVAPMSDDEVLSHLEAEIQSAKGTTVVMAMNPFVAAMVAKVLKMMLDRMFASE